MACPFFLPTEKLGAGGWDPAPRVTFGEAWSGRCDLDQHAPAENELRDWCNRGYARGACPRFPADAPDAVRFAWNSRQQLIFILETDHKPGEIGLIGEDTEQLRLAQGRAFKLHWPGAGEHA